MPRRPFRHPEDAFEQLTRAVACHERLFGRPPAGLWPSEGSVSDAMVPLVAKAGFTWMATDEQILGRTLGLTFSRDAAGQVDQPDRLYIPYRVKAGARAVACAFRDHALSDLIGFSYAGWPADAAADDFVARLADAGRAVHGRGRQGRAGRLRHPRRRKCLGAFRGRRTTVSARPLRAARRPSGAPDRHDERGVPGRESRAARHLPGIVDRRELLHLDRPSRRSARLEPAGRCARGARRRPGRPMPAPSRAPARKCSSRKAATGSGGTATTIPPSTTSSSTTCSGATCGMSTACCSSRCPTSSSSATSRRARTPPAEYGPTGLLTPTLDGEDTSYFEWLGAGTLEVRETAGAMHQTERRPPVITQVRFGFDHERLYVSLAGTEQVLDLLAQGHELSLKFLKPDGVRFSVRASIRPAARDVLGSPAGGALLGRARPGRGSRRGGPAPGGRPPAGGPGTTPPRRRFRAERPACPASRSSSPSMMRRARSSNGTPRTIRSKPRFPAAGSRRGTGPSERDRKAQRLDGRSSCAQTVCRPAPVLMLSVMQQSSAGQLLHELTDPRPTAP